MSLFSILLIGWLRSWIFCWKSCDQALIDIQTESTCTEQSNINSLCQNTTVIKSVLSCTFDSEWSGGGPGLDSGFILWWEHSSLSRISCSSLSFINKWKYNWYYCYCFIEDCPLSVGRVCQPITIKMNCPAQSNVLLTVCVFTGRIFWTKSISAWSH